MDNDRQRTIARRHFKKPHDRGLPEIIPDTITSDKIVDVDGIRGHIFLAELTASVCSTDLGRLRLLGGNVLARNIDVGVVSPHGAYG